MRNYYLIILALIFVLKMSCAPQKYTRDIDVTEYNIEVHFENPGKVDFMVDVISKINPKLDHIEFLLTPGAEIDSVSVEHNGIWKKLSYSTIKDTIRISIPPEISIGTEHPMRFVYSTPVRDTIGDFLYLDRGFRYYPLIIDDVAKVKIAATVPAGYKMFSGGDLVDIKTKKSLVTYKYATKIPVFKIPIVLIRPDNYSLLTKQCNGKGAEFYFLKQKNNSNLDIVEEICKTLQYYESNIGEFHHNNLTFIEIDQYPRSSFIGTGLVLSGTQVVANYKKEKYQGLYLLIAAQWFGAGVFGDFQSKGFWFFTLSLPHYLRLMYTSESYGEQEFKRELQTPYDKYLNYSDSDHDMPTMEIDMPNKPVKIYNIKGRGPMILNQLRIEMGDENWHEFVQSLYKKMQGKVMIYEMFKEHLAKFADEKIVGEFDRMVNSRGDINQSQNE
ncbi:MAG: hypothetical protein K9M80_08195 [Candidatus Marinimicrobia bacterium]|nr:hypothetical protein [Candidatus Neomarinimicrobiota bacterium]